MIVELVTVIVPSTWLYQLPFHDAAAAVGARVVGDGGVGDRHRAGLKIPPPTLPAELLAMVALITVIVPLLTTPPP